MTNEMTDDNQKLIFHVTNAEGVTQSQAAGVFACDSLESEGFIHCCEKQQLAGVLERYYAGVAGLQLLEIDPEKLDARLVYENTVGGEELFPHVYGTINMSAVVKISAL